MTKAEMVLFIHAARRSGVSWSNLVKFFGLSKERLAQIGGYRIHRSVRKSVIARAAGHCQLCQQSTKKVYVAKIDVTKDNSEENLIACCRYCFYDQNKADRNAGVEIQVNRRNGHAEILLAQIAQDLGIDTRIPVEDLDGLAPSSGQETPPVPQETAPQPIPEDGDGTRSDNGAGSLGG